MSIQLIVVSLCLLLSACGATQAPAYQQDRAPEDRDQYSGAQGMAQYQEDQTYLMRKALADKCAQAKIDLVLAEKESNQDEKKKQQRIIHNACT